MNIEAIKKIPLINFLASLGHHPQKISGKEYKYKSPYRDENTASFSVNIQKNVWIDFGTGEGGGIFRLAEKLFNETNIFRLIQLIEKNMARPIAQAKNFLSEKEKKENVILIENVQDITRPVLTNYFQKRGIDLNIACQYCKEVHYRIGDNNFYSIGFKNNSGGWELRNPNLKSGIAPKDVTHIKNSTDQLTVFEGFFDFLSFKQLESSEKLSLNSELLEGLLKEKSDYLILNSTAFLKKSLPIIRQYGKANLFLDNDATGLSAASSIESTLVRTANFSVLYQGFNDLNEWLVNNAQKERTQSHQLKHRTNKGLHL